MKTIFVILAALASAPTGCSSEGPSDPPMEAPPRRKLVEAPLFGDAGPANRMIDPLLEMTVTAQFGWIIVPADGSPAQPVVQRRIVARAPAGQEVAYLPGAASGVFMGH